MISRPSPPSSARCGLERQTSAASPAMSADGIYGKLATIMSSFSGGGSGVSRSPRKTRSPRLQPLGISALGDLQRTVALVHGQHAQIGPPMPDSVSATAPEPVPISTTAAVVAAPATARCFPPCLRAAKALTSPATAGSAAMPVAASSASAGSAAAGLVLHGQLQARHEAMLHLGDVRRSVHLPPHHRPRPGGLAGRRRQLVQQRQRRVYQQLGIWPWGSPPRRSRAASARRTLLPRSGTPPAARPGAA